MVNGGKYAFKNPGISHITLKTPMITKYLTTHSYAYVVYYAWLRLFRYIHNVMYIIWYYCKSLSFSVTPTIDS